jgi:hypothetical protein
VRSILHAKWHQVGSKSIKVQLGRLMVRVMLFHLTQWAKCVPLVVTFRRRDPLHQPAQLGLLRGAEAAVRQGGTSTWIGRYRLTGTCRHAGVCPPNCFNGFTGSECHTASSEVHEYWHFISVSH